MRLAPAIFFLAMFAAAQTSTPLEIRGIVTEAGGGGIEGVQVGVSGVGDATPRTALTDARGEFRLIAQKAGTFFVFANKDGYFAAPNTQFAQAVNVGPGMTPTLVSLTLVRSGQVGGRVLDQETRQPVPGTEVFLYARRATYGRVGVSRAGPGDQVLTDREGRFLFTGRPSGAYLASAHVTLQPAERVISSFSTADLDIVDQAYADTYWPGGGGVESALPVNLTGGGYADVGSISIRKVPQYRVHVVIPQGDCVAGESVKLSVLQAGSTASIGVFPCGSEVLLRGFDSGSYMIYAVSNRQGGRPDMETAVWGNARLVIGDKNAEVTVPLQHGRVIEGQLVVGEGMAALAGDPGISTRPIDVMEGARPDAETFIRWGEDHKFTLAVSPNHAQSLLVREPFLNSGLYARQIRYNGVPLREFVIPSTGVATNKLEIVMDDKRAVVSGNVTDGSRSIPDAYVMMVPDGTRAQDLPEAWNQNTQARNGSFSISGMTPGDYRLFAVTADQRDKIHEPGVLDRILATAQKIAVTLASQVVTLRVSDAR